MKYSKNPKTNIFIVSGPSGSGKTTLCNRLLRLKALKGRLRRSVSVTTRPSRGREQHKKDYIFVSRKEFLRRKRRGGFLETQPVFGYLYGTPKSFVKKALKKKSVLLCIDVKGALVVKRAYADAVMIFILPPSLEILQKRLTNRLTEDKKELYRRLQLAKREIGYLRHYDYVIVNDELKKATRQLEAIITAEQSRRC